MQRREIKWDTFSVTQKANDNGKVFFVQLSIWSFGNVATKHSVRVELRFSDKIQIYSSSNGVEKTRMKWNQRKRLQSDWRSLMLSSCWFREKSGSDVAFYDIALKSGFTLVSVLEKLFVRIWNTHLYSSRTEIIWFWNIFNYFFYL